jgi:hypothetical protein
MRKSLFYAALALAVSAVAATAAIAAPTKAGAAHAATVKQKAVTTGFYEGKTISYFD